MKTKSSLSALLALMTLFLSVVSGQTGGGYELSHNVIAGGGGSSTGSSFTVEGTAGQAAAGTTMSNGQFSLTSGFWQSDSAPTLLYSIGGQLTYANGVTAGKNVTMTLNGPAGFVPLTTTTDSSGNYSFANVPAGGNYTVTPSKTGDVNGIESFDASNVARYAAGLDIPTANQLIAADADGDNLLTSFDASLIARRVAGLPGTGIVGTWKFSPASRTYTTLSGPQLNQTFTAILVGDTSGNWMPSIHSGGPGDNARVSAGSALNPHASPNTPLAVTVALPHVTGPAGSMITVPMTVGDLTGQGVKAYDLQITFDPTKVQPQGTPHDTAGTRSSGMLITPNAFNPGHLIISAFQATDLTGSGTLINLKFTIVGAPGQSTPTTFDDYTDPGMIFHPGFRFNAGNPVPITSNGSINVNGPTAAAARISGQIVTTDGQPVSGATITVLGGAGTIRAITDSNGFYKVENLETGGFYSVTPSRANFVFAPVNRAFSLVADQMEAVFTGLAIGPDANPLESPEFFVRQQYLDFLGREPDQGGLDFWSGQLRACGVDPECFRARKIRVSAAFFIEQEFQDSGLFIYDLYQGALGRRPQFVEYAADRTKVIGGPTLEGDKVSFTENFVERAEFRQQYPLTLTADLFVEALLNTAQQSSGIDLSDKRANLINLYNSGANATQSRSLVVRSVAEADSFKHAQYNSAFVLMEYFGYLRRNADQAGYVFWLDQINSAPRRDTSRQQAMVCSFITSAEYQRRFSPVITHSNTECQ